MMGSAALRFTQSNLYGREWASVFFLCSILIFPRSFVFLKLLFIFLFVMAHVPFLLKSGIRLQNKILYFYLAVSILGCAWSLIGVHNNGAETAIFDGVRLYVIWSFAFLLIFNILYSDNFFLVFHRAIVISGIVISLVNFFALFNHAGGYDLIGYDTLKELDMFVGFHDGYIQITSHNIGSLFFVASYLLAVQFRRDAAPWNTGSVKLSLAMCLILVALSGRRALWLALFLEPFLIIIVSICTRSANRLYGYNWFSGIALFACVSLPLLLWLIIYSDLAGNPTLAHLMAAFSEEDERSIQVSYLIEGFKAYPFFGSGFGGFAGYLRNEQSPWLYELTYFQLLFNFGIVGVFFMLVLAAVYFNYVRKVICIADEYSGIAFSLFLGFGILAVGAYSNPYFGSFDFLVIVGVLPLVAAYYSALQSS